MRLRAVLPVLAATALTVAGPAHADPEDGEGCAGLPGTAAYVCVISVTPTNALPSLGGGGSVTVPVPRVCYVAGCVGPTSVDVPVPGAQPGDGAVAVLWWNGSYIPIAVGSVPSLGPLPDVDPGPLPVDGEDVGRLIERIPEIVGRLLEEEVGPVAETVQERLDQIRDIDLARVVEVVMERVGDIITISCNPVVCS